MKRFSELNLLSKFILECAPYPIREGISGENGPGSPVCVMAIVLMDVFTKTINIMGWKLGRQLEVLVRKNQWCKCSVKPRGVKKNTKNKESIFISQTVKKTQKRRWKAGKPDIRNKISMC